MNTQANREAMLNLEAVDPSELAQVEGGWVWFALFAVGVGLLAGRNGAQEQAAREAQEASEMSAVLGALKQGGII
ncbi:MAG: hypothetical protein AB7U20_01940 [Planctomycetaceae bacterium]